MLGTLPVPFPWFGNHLLLLRSHFSELGKPAFPSHNPPPSLFVCPPSKSIRHFSFLPLFFCVIQGHLYIPSSGTSLMICFNGFWSLDHRIAGAPPTSPHFLLGHAGFLFVLRSEDLWCALRSLAFRSLTAEATTAWADTSFFISHFPPLKSLGLRPPP